MATDPDFAQALTVSLVVTLTRVVAAIMVAFLGALAISRFRFRGRASFVLTLLLIRMLPAEGLFIAQYTMMSSLGLRGSIQASASRETDWGQVMAASTIVALPVIIFFLVVQGRMSSGLVCGAVKG